MWMRTLRWFGLVVVAVAVVSTNDRAWGIGFMLGKSKEELKLKYDVTVEEHTFDGKPTGRVTIVFTLVDEGRLKPLEEVQFAIPGQEKNADGSSWMDLVVSIYMYKTDEGKRVGRVHIRKEWAERGEIRLNTHTMDGKPDGMTRLIHVIPIAKYMKNAPAPAARPVANAASPPPAAAAPPATERKKD